MAEDLVYGAAARKNLLEPIRRAYLFFGEDDHQKDDAIAQLKAACIDESFAEFDLEIIEASTHNCEAILSSANLAPFGSPFRLVVVRGAEIFRRRERQADADSLAASLPFLGSATCLVLRASHDPDAGRTKTILSAKLDAAIRASGLVVRFRPLSDEDMIGMLIARGAAAGKRLESQAASRLVRACQGDRTALGNELDKVICFAGDRPGITLDDVEAVCSYNAEDVMFKLVDAVTSRNADRALSLLSEMLRYDTRPQGLAGRLLSLLSRQYRLLWQARALLDKRLDAGSLKSLPRDIGDQLPSEASIQSVGWKTADTFRAARSWDLRAIGRALESVLDCDLANKGGLEGSEDVVTNLQLLILNLCAAKSAK